MVTDAEEKQSTMAIALTVATTINDCCETVEDVKETFALLSNILELRFGITLHVSLKG